MKTFSKIAIAALGAALLSVPVAASAADYYGAFAFSQNTGASGWAKNYRSQSEAEGAALQVCFQTRGASDCKVAYSFVNSCAALAVGLAIGPPQDHAPAHPARRHHRGVH